MFGIPFEAIIIGAIALGAVLVALWLYRRGADRERTRQLEETLASKERQDEAAANAPRDRDGLTSRLRRGGF